MTTAIRSVTFGSATGMHARPAAILSTAAAQSGHSVTFTGPSGAAADAASVLMLLSMGVSHGDELTIEVDGDDAERVADELASLASSELDTESGENAQSVSR